MPMDKHWLRVRSDVSEPGVRSGRAKRPRRRARVAMGSDHAVGAALARGHGGSPPGRRTRRRRRPCGRLHGGRKRYRAILAVGGGRLSCRARGRCDCRPRAHQVGVAPTRRARACGRRDDRRDRRSPRQRRGAAGVAPLHLGVQHDGAGGAGLSRPSTTSRRRRIAPAAQSLGRGPAAGRQPRRRGDRVGPTDLSIDDGRARPIGESARAADAAGARRAGQREPHRSVCPRPQTSQRICAM